MDPRLLRHYNQELQHLREMGAEFAKQFPKIAARLTMDGVEVADPYVERLLEGTAFLAARVQLKLDEEFPRFTQRMLQIVHPHALDPTPSMLVAQLEPEVDNPALKTGALVPRGTAMTGRKPPGETTACEFRTGQDVRLWPVKMEQARYLAHAGELPLAGLPYARRVKGALRMRLQTGAGIPFSELAMDKLRLYFAGGEEIAFKLHELCTGNVLGVIVSDGKRTGGQREVLPASAVSLAGFDDEEALLPVTLRSFQGHRLLREYYAFPQRFLFADIDGLAPVLAKFPGKQIDIDILLSDGVGALEQQVSEDNVLLNCTPAINLFPKRAGRTLVTEGTHDFHVVVDRARPLDFEVHSLVDVRGFAAGNDGEQAFHPLYAAYHREPSGVDAFYVMQREPRMMSEQGKRKGFRSGYIGSEVFVSIVDRNEAPWPKELKQLSFNTLCSNRDLPLLMPVGGTRGDLELDHAAPVAKVRCVKGPSRPHAPSFDAGLHWRSISQLSQSYLSILDASPEEGAAALRSLLALNAPVEDAATRNQIAGVMSVKSAQVVRRLPMAGPIAFGRGLKVEVSVDEMAFSGGSAYLLGCVLDVFFARHVSINSVVETALDSGARGGIYHGPPRCGARRIG